MSETKKELSEEEKAQLAAMAQPPADHVKVPQPLAQALLVNLSEQIAAKQKELGQLQALAANLVQASKVPEMPEDVVSDKSAEK